MEELKRSFSLKGALSSLSLSPDKTMCAAAGRDSISVVSLAGSTNNICRQISKTSQKNTICDISWHPIARELIATSSVNGAVHVWDANTDKREDEYKNSMNIQVGFQSARWKRRVNRLCWHPTNQNLLLLGVQDGFVKLLDWRARESEQNPLLFPFVLPNRAASVRDIRFSPHDPFLFLSAMEDGSVRLWDTRKQSCQLFQVQAHLRLAVSVDWHPSHKGVFASCGSDGVKVWNTLKWSLAPSSTSTSNSAAIIASFSGDSNSRPLYNMHSSSSVAVIKWRSDNSDEIASCASTLDFKIYVWNIRRPFIPVAQLCGHSDVTTDFAWLDNSTIVSCSKDTTLRVDNIASATKPFENIRTASLSYHPQGHIAAVKEVIDRNNPISHQDIAYLSNPFIDEPSSDSIPRFINFFSPIGTDFSFSSPIEISIESVFKSLSELSSLEPSERSNNSKNKIISELSDDIVFKIIAKKSHIGLSDTAMNQWEICEHNAKVCDIVERPQWAQIWRLARCAFEPIQDVDDANPTHEQQHLGFDPSAIFSSVADTVVETKTVTNSLSSVLSVEETTTGNTMTEGLLLPVTAPYEDELPDLLRNETVMPITVLPDLRIFAVQTSSGNSTLEGPLMDEDRMVDNAQTFQKDWSLSSKMLQEAVIQTLIMYSANGDLQICALIALVLGNQAVPVDLASKWVLAYINTLQRLKMFLETTEVIRSCGPDLVAPMLNYGDPIGSLNKKATVIKTGYPDSRNQSQKSISRCSICDLPVRGLYVWCQGCGHGGHLEHMKTWFESNTRCPIGCGHTCKLATVLASPIASPSQSPF